MAMMWVVDISGARRCCWSEGVRSLNVCAGSR